MGTRANLIVAFTATDYRVTVVSYDGYVHGLGKVLAAHYAAPARARKLSDGGDARHVLAGLATPRATAVAWYDNRNSFFWGTRGFGFFNAARRFPSMKAALEACDGEYIFLFDGADWFAGTEGDREDDMLPLAALLGLGGDCEINAAVSSAANDRAAIAREKEAARAVKDAAIEAERAAAMQVKLDEIMGIAAADPRYGIESRYTHSVDLGERCDERGYLYHGRKTVPVADGKLMLKLRDGKHVLPARVTYCEEETFKRNADGVMELDATGRILRGVNPFRGKPDPAEMALAPKGELLTIESKGTYAAAREAAEAVIGPDRARIGTRYKGVTISYREFHAFRLALEAKDGSAPEFIARRDGELEAYAETLRAAARDTALALDVAAFEAAGLDELTF